MEAKLAPSSCFRVDGDIVVRKIADEVVLVPIRGHLADMQRLFVLTPIGEYIWDRLCRKESAGSIVDALTTDYDVTRAQAESDLAEFVAELITARLVAPLAAKTGQGT